jgi:FAD:protein FMN transferase
VRSTVPETPEPLISGSQVVSTMGTVFSFDLRDPVSTVAFADGVELLYEIDAMFSTYRADSTISRLRRGDARVQDCPIDVLEVLGLCEIATELTDNYFTAFPDGELDPTGLVKGWAIQRVSQLLIKAGSRHHSVNGGGDIQLVGGIDDETPWRVGITNPLEVGKLLAVAELHDGAIATSGTAERGTHIVDPTTGEAATHFVSVTITAPTILEADVLATAAFARGPDGPDWIEELEGVEGLFLTPDGCLTSTTAFPTAAEAN